MTIDYQRLRIEGVYKQNDAGHLMLRVKVPAGVLSAEQALKVADIAERFSNDGVHLTSRGSIEFHWLQYADLSEALRLLAAVGLTSRGACGGAVRGVVCSTTFGEGFPVVQSLARKLHRHFAGNPHFEGLPKKFKIGVDAGYGGSRHLIQDVGLVYVGTEEFCDLYDVWLAGGLGREPQPGFRYAEGVAEGRILPLLEAVLRLYKRHAPKGKRLKHVLRELGEATFRRLLETDRALYPTELELADAVEKRLTALPHAPRTSVTAAVFAGELSSKSLRIFAHTAARLAEGFMVLTADQDVAFLLADADDAADVREALAAAGYAGETTEERVTFRICPGGHECRMGLCRTREVAREVIAALGETGKEGSWAIAGCPNSCSQPQLADFGIVTAKSVPGADGVRRPLFDLHRRQGAGFGEKIAEQLDQNALLEAVRNLG
ncbi:MAG: nitrite/sulfite reductase [Desulfuromonadales bacterium]